MTPHRPSSPAVVRRGRLTDLTGVVRCQTDCWREAYAGLVAEDYLYAPEIEQRRRDRWAARLAGERDVWVAETAGELIGVASAGPSREVPPVTPEELMSLYVRTAWHGTGVGARLLTAVLGDRPASLWVFELNLRAQAFYRRHGFVPDGLRTVDADTGVPEIRMVRRPPGR